MGVYYTVRIDGMTFLHEKGMIPDALLSLFQEDEKVIISKQDLLLSNPDIVKKYDDEVESFYFYAAPLKVIQQRLDILGISIERMRYDFNISLPNYIEEIKRNFERTQDLNKEKGIDEEYIENIYNTMRVRRGFSLYTKNMILELDVENYTFDIWKDIIEKSLSFYNDYVEDNESDDTPDETYSSYTYAYFAETHGFPHRGWDPRYLIRLAVEMFDGEQFILDYTDLVYGEGISGNDDLLLEAKDYEKLSIPLFSKAIVITEGTTDYYFLSNCLKIIYPKLMEMIHFVNFGEVNANGGVSSVVAFLKILQAAGIPNRVLALFDSDTAARDGVRGLELNRLPKNITVSFLPPLPEFTSWPTVGPQGEDIEIDINGKAVSIELFFPDKFLHNETGKKYPVQWKGFNPSLRQYQGEITNKTIIQEGFRDYIKSHNSGKIVIQEEELRAMKILIDYIISELKSNYEAKE